MLSPTNYPSIRVSDEARIVKKKTEDSETKWFSLSSFLRFTICRKLNSKHYLHNIEYNLHVKLVTLLIFE